MNKQIYLFTIMYLIIGLGAAVYSYNETKKYSGWNETYEHYLKEIEFDHFAEKIGNKYNIILEKSHIVNSSLKNTLYNEHLIDNLSNLSYESEKEKVLYLYNYVNSLNYSKTPGPQDPNITIKQGGDCWDKAILFSILLNHNNISNYIVLTEPNNYVGHAYNLVNISGQWLPFDTTGSLYTDYNDISMVYNDKEVRIT